MRKISEAMISAMFIILLSGCTGPLQSIRDDNPVLDYDWQLDIYNLALTQVLDATNFRVWTIKTPDYYGESPHQIACIEITQPLEPNRYYIANLNIYALTEVKDCIADFWSSRNFAKTRLRSQW